MSDKYSSKKDKDLLGKKKKLNLDTFLQEVESNPKKKET